MKSKSIPSQTFLLVLLALVGYLFYQILRPFLFSLILAMTLTSLFYPNFLLLKRLLWGRAVLASVVMSLIIMILIIIPLVFFFVLLVDELNDGYRLLLSNHQKLLNLLEKPYPSILDPIVDRINVLLQKNTFSLSSFSASRLEGFVRFAISQTSAVLGSFGWFVINFIVMIFCMFFLFRDGHFLFARFQELIPLSSSHQKVLFEKLQKIIYATFLGIFVTGLFQGVLAGLMFMILGIQKPVIWAAAVACVSVVPIFGTAIIWMPIALYLIFVGSLVKGIVLLLFGTFVIALVDNILRPLIIEGQAEGMHVLLLFFALAGGLLFFGPLGLLLGPLITALLIALLEIYQLELQNSR